MILENENKIKELYEISPTKYLYLPLGDIEINGDNIISYDKDKKYLYSYYFEKSFKKIDFNIGYKKIYLNESMYLKLNKTISSL